MHNIWYIWIAYIAGSGTTFFIMRGMMKHLRRGNALLRNESDYYYMLMKVAFKSLHHHEQELFDTSDEVRRIKETYYKNQERINKTGKY